MSVGSAATKLMNADEFFDWVHRPENDNRWFELVRGEVIELPPPLKPHGVVCYNVARVVGDYVAERAIGYVAINDAGVILERDPDTVRGPDVAVYDDAETFEELHPKYGEVPLSWSSRSYPRTTAQIGSPGKCWTIFATESAWSG